MLLTKQGMTVSGISFRVLTDYSNWTDSENEIAYYGINSLRTWRQVLTTLQVAMGDYTNYGYLYALANYIAEECGWQQDVYPETTIDILKNDSSLLNLVYPCFAENYTDAEYIAVCKTVSRKIFPSWTIFGPSRIFSRNA